MGVVIQRQEAAATLLDRGNMSKSACGYLDFALAVVTGAGVGVAAEEAVGESGEAFGDEFGGVFIASWAVNAIEDHDDDALVITSGGDGNRKARGCNITRLEAIHAVHVAKQMVVSAHDHGLAGNVLAEGSLARGGIGRLHPGGDAG